jgi:hypothetical protein
MLATNRVLEGVEIVCGQGPFKHKDALTFFGESALDDEGIGIHSYRAVIVGQQGARGKGLE